MYYLVNDIDESYSELETDDIHLKKRVIDTLSVFEEGYQFTPMFRSGIWDGKKHFYSILPNTNIKFLKGLVSYIIKDLQTNNLEYRYNQLSFKTGLDFNEFSKFVETLNLPFSPYDYQVQAAFDMINDKRGVFSSATSSGKSLILYIFLMWMLENKKKSLLVVPSISLTLQMKSDFEDYGLKDSERLIKLIGGEFNNKDLGTHPIIISTWQSLFQMNKESFYNFEAIAVDECHSVRGDALQSIVLNANNAEWKIGVTGTVPRTRADKLQLLGTLGRVYNVISPQGLIDRGLASPVHINLLYLNYSAQDRAKAKGLKMKYQDEEKYIASHQARNYKIPAIMKKLTAINGGENVLALFTKIEHGRLLLRNAVSFSYDKEFELIDKITPKNIKEAIERFNFSKTTFFLNQEITDADLIKIKKISDKIQSGEKTIEFINNIRSLTELDIYFIYGAVDGVAREEIRKILELKKGVQIIGSFGTVSTGINYKNLHHLVLAASTKSFIRLSQTVGRGMRKHESKKGVQIWDMIDDLTYKTARSKKENYFLKHSYERIEIYREQGYPLKEKEIRLD